MKTHFTHYLALLLLFSLAVPTLKAGTTVDHFAADSRLASGKWVKISVDRSGMYEIPFSKLTEWGFSNPQAVNVYGFSGVEHNSQIQAPAPDDLPMLRVLRSNDKMIFYAQGPVKTILKRTQHINLTDPPMPEFDEYGNPIIPDEPFIPDTIITYTTDHNYIKDAYSNVSTYLLSDCITQSEPITIAEGGNAQGEHLNYHYSIQRRYFDEYMDAPGGAIFYSRPIEKNQKRAVSFDMPGYLKKANVRYQFAALASNPGYGLTIDFSSTAAKIDSSANVNAFMANSSDYFCYDLSSEGVQYFKPVSGTHHEVIFTSLGNHKHTGLYHATLEYMRSNELTDSAQMLMMYPELTENAVLDFTNSPADMQLWDVTDEYNPQEIALQGTGNTTASVKDKRNYVLAAFSPSATLPSPTYVGEIVNQNLHHLTTPDMVIVTNDLFAPEAERLARLHRECHQKLKVEVVKDYEIFNEFSSGSKSAEAVRKFLQMLYLRNPQKMKYAIIFGAGTYDNRGIMNHNGHDYMVTYQTDSLYFARNETLSQSSDAYFGIVDPKYEDTKSNNSKLYREVVRVFLDASIAVGRIPAESLTDARNYVDKVEEYLHNPIVAGQMNRAMCVGDIGDKNKHVMEGCETDANYLIANLPGATVNKVYQELQPNYTIASNSPMSYSFREALKQPVGLMLYSGHGSPKALGKISFFYRSMEKTTEYGSMPFFFAGACSPYGWDNPAGSLMSQMVLHPKQGPIALVGPARTAFMTPNQAYGHAMTREYVNADGRKDCLGDVYLRAFNYMMHTSMSSRCNTMLYSMAGDPALPLYKPSLNIEITSAQDSGEKSDSTITLQPGSTNALAGRIMGPDNKQYNFDGTLTLTLYEPSQVTPLRGLHEQDWDYPASVTVDQTPVYTTSIAVKGGKWNATITLPEMEVPESAQPYRISLYGHIVPEKGYKAERMLTATGLAYANMDFANTGKRKSNDTKAPEITDLQAVNHDNGATIKATITDAGSGISFSPMSQPKLWLDGKQLSDARHRFQAVEPGVYALRYPMLNLPEGFHTVRLSVSDVAGNVATADYSFTTSSTIGTVILSLDNDIVTEKYMVIDCADAISASSGKESLLLITDAEGNTVHTTQNPGFPYNYDASKLADGIYTAQVLISTPQGTTQSRPVTFTVLRHIGQ